MAVMEKDERAEWAAKWLDKVTSGSSTMSQRKLSVVEKRCGLETLKLLAEKRKVHLLQIEDDQGNELIAASVNPFTVIC